MNWSSEAPQESGIYIVYFLAPRGQWVPAVVQYDREQDAYTTVGGGVVWWHPTFKRQRPVWHPMPEAPELPEIPIQMELVK